MSGEFEGKRIVLTGGGGDIAIATAPLLLAAGARLHLVDIDGTRLAMAKKKVGGGRRVSVHQSDLATPASCAKALDTAGGKLYGLVHLAGVFERDTLDPKRREVWDRAIASNLTNAYDMSVAFIPRADPKQTCRIIFLSSLAATRGSHLYVAYSAAKAGLIGLARALAPALAPKILVNGLAPGLIDTRMPAEHLRLRGEEMIKNIPLGRIGTSAEVSTVIEFLLSAASSYITGQTISVDGGVIRR